MRQKRFHRIARALGAGSLCLLIMSIAVSPVSAVGGKAVVLPPESSPGGKTYGEWSVAWWQWMVSAPALPGENPVLDETGALIDYAQSGSVWFLTGNIGGVTVRTGSVPTGTMLFIGPIAGEASTWEGLGETEAELRAAVASFADLYQVTEFDVDGVSVPIGSDFRVQSPGMFSLTVPEDNVFDFWGFPADAGTYYPCVSDGYFIMLAPLSAGTHTVHFAFAVPDWGWYSDVTYQLNVMSARSGSLRAPDSAH